MKKIKTILTKITLSLLTILLLTIGSFNVRSYKKEIYADELNTTTNLLGIIGTYYLQNLGMQLSSASSIGNQFLNYITNTLGLAASSVLAYFQVKKQNNKTEIDISNAGVSLLNSFKNWIVENGTTNIFTYGNGLENFLAKRYLRHVNDNYLSYQLSYDATNIPFITFPNNSNNDGRYGYSSPYINSNNYPNLYEFCNELFNHNNIITWSQNGGSNTAIITYKFNAENYFVYIVDSRQLKVTRKIINNVSTSYSNYITNNINIHYVTNPNTAYPGTSSTLVGSYESAYENMRFGMFLYNNNAYLGNVYKLLDSNNEYQYHIQLINTDKPITLSDFNTENNTINYENIINNNVVSDNLDNSEQIYRLTIQNTENIENIEDLLAYIELSISNLQSIITSNIVSIESGATDEDIENSNWFRIIVSSLGNFFSTPIAWIGNLFDSLKSHMTSGWDSLVSGIKDIFDVDVDDSIATELTETIEDSETAEGYLTDVFENTIEDIELTPVTTFGTKFSNSTNWVKEQYENLTNDSPYGALVTYSLSIGFILLLIGRGIF